MKLLIVDDSMMMRDTIERYLEDYDLDIIGTASNGADAIEQVKEKQPDVVTLDMQCLRWMDWSVLKKSWK